MMSPVILIIAAVVLIGLIWAMCQSSLSFGQWLLVILVAGLVSGGMLVGFMTMTGQAMPPMPGPDPMPGPGDGVMPVPGSPMVIVNGLGLVLVNANQPGAYVMDVIPGSEADQFGFSRRELITHIDDVAIESIDDAAKALDGKKAGDTLSVSVMSDDGMSGWGGSMKLENDLSIER